jgi:hypothetical protein
LAGVSRFSFSDADFSGRGDGMIDFLVTVAGVVMIVEGIPWFLSPPRMKRTLLGFLGLPDRVLRAMGLLLMLGGLLLVYLVRG